MFYEVCNNYEYSFNVLAYKSHSELGISPEGGLTSGYNMTTGIPVKKPESPSESWYSCDLSVTTYKEW